MFEIENKVEVTHQNFEEIMYPFLYAYKKAHYNKMCFSSSDIRRYVVCDRSIDLMIEEIIDAGYCPYQLIKPIEKTCELKLGIIPHKKLKQDLDKDFKIIVNGVVVELGKAYLEAV